jgi:hypothetical protein
MLAAAVEQPAFHSRLMDRMRREGLPPSKTRTWLPYAYPLAGAAAAFVLIALAASLYFLMKPIAPSETPAVASAPHQSVSPTAQPPEEQPAAVSADEHTGDDETSTETEQLLATTLPLKLTGTVTGPDAMAAITMTTTGKSMSLGVGDSIVEGVRVHQIERGRVLLDNHGTIEYLETYAAPDAMPSVEGYWVGTVKEGPDQGRSSEFEFSEPTPGALRIAKLAEVKAREFAEGPLRGNHADLVLLEEAQAVGEFNADRTRFTLTADLQTLYGGDQPAPLRMVFERPSETEQTSRLAFHDQREEVQAMFEALQTYARNDPENRFPLSLDALGNAGNLFAQQEGRTIVYYPGARLLPSMLPEFKEGFEQTAPESFPDRLVAWEKALAELWGPSFPGMNMLRAAYNDPANTFVANSLQGVWAEKEANTDPEASRASCANNMKQLGLICKIYVNENHGYLPAGWRSIYPDYLSDVRILTCPAAEPGTLSYELLFPATSVSYLEEIGVEVSEKDSNRPGGHALIRSVVPTIAEKGRHIGEDGTRVRCVCFIDGHVEFLNDAAYAEKVAPFLSYR